MSSETTGEQTINTAGMPALASQRLPAPVIFVGYQKLGIPGIPEPMELWNLTEDLPDHPQGSTVSRWTLEKAGYTVPAPPGAKEEVLCG